MYNSNHIMSSLSNFSRLNVENNTNHDIAVMPFENYKGDVDWKQLGKTALWGGLAMVSLIPGVGQAASRIGTAVASAAFPANASKTVVDGFGNTKLIPAQGIVKYASKLAKKPFGTVGAFYKFAESLNESFKYGGDTKNMRPKDGGSFNLQPGESKYIVDRDTKAGFSNGVKDIITGITLKVRGSEGIISPKDDLFSESFSSIDDPIVGKQIALDLGRYAIDNPIVGRSTAFWASPAATQIAKVSDTSTRHKSQKIPNTNITYEFTSYGTQYDPSINAQTETWGLTFSQDVSPMYEFLDLPALT